jgi:NADH:ubiquinone oxidoreductase subunit E
MPLLYLASLEHGYVSNEAMIEVSELVGLTPAQVQSVSTFYTMFKQETVGSYLISVCTSISCHLLNSDDVLGSVEQSAGASAGSTNEDGLISVERAECIGACGGAPAIQVNYETVEGLTPEKAEALVEWLTNATPEVVLADEMQHLFGGIRSFDWGPTDDDGAIRPVPAFEPYGSAREGR